MTPEETTQLYLLACAASRQQPSEREQAAWVWLLDDLAADEAVAAVKRHCREEKWMPQPAEIVDQVRRLNGDVPPTLEAAVGYYLSGEHDAHSLVAKAAEMSQWDYRHPEVATQAKFDFRNHYQGLLDQEQRRQAREDREQLTGGPIAQLLSGEPIDDAVSPT